MYKNPTRFTVSAILHTVLKAIYSQIFLLQYLLIANEGGMGRKKNRKKIHFTCGMYLKIKAVSRLEIPQPVQGILYFEFQPGPKVSFVVLNAAKQ